MNQAPLSKAELPVTLKLIKYCLGHLTLGNKVQRPHCGTLMLAGLAGYKS